MKRRSIFILGVVSCSLAAGGGYVWWKDPFAVAAAYRLAKIERGSITAAVAATGTLNPVVSVQVGSQVSGQIKELYADLQLAGEERPVDRAHRSAVVHAAREPGDGRRRSRARNRAHPALERRWRSRPRSRARRCCSADAEREYNRNQMLFEKNFVSAAVRDKALATLDAAREQLKAAQAQVAVGQAQVRNAEAVVKQRESQLAQARVDLDRTEIRAPVDGIVVKKSVEPGQTVAASLQAPELFVIAQDLRQMQVDASIDESEVGRIRVGQEATFTVDSFPGRTFRGTVSQVRKAAQVVQNVVTYIAVITHVERGPGTLSRHDRERARHRRHARERAQGAECRAALPARGRGDRARPRARAAAPAAAAGDEKGKGKGKARRFLERLTKELAAQRRAALESRSDHERHARQDRRSRHRRPGRAPPADRAHARRIARAHRRSAHAPSSA